MAVVSCDIYIYDEFAQKLKRFDCIAIAKRRDGIEQTGTWIRFQKRGGQGQKMDRDLNKGGRRKGDGRMKEETRNLEQRA
jgi:hypothetical protein